MADAVAISARADRFCYSIADETADGESMEKALERVHLLENDMRVIRSAIECMNSRYKKCILWRHVSKYSWTKISYQFSQPESTVRYCYDKALEHLGEILDKDVQDIEGLTDRASRAY